MAYFGKIYEDLTGKVFGRWTVVSEAEYKNRKHWWNCVCECGNKRVCRTSTLTHADSSSCGCLTREKASKRSTTHGKHKSKIYGSWAAMKGRCTNPNDPSYFRYGGRGINVCEKWMKFENFYKDMGDPPKGMSLDRIDNDKGYYKENCRWAARREQQNNTRRNVFITYKGLTKTRAEWARHFNIPPGVLLGRFKRGDSLDRMFRPLGAKKKNGFGKKK